jgi:hypothetical protein
MSAPKLEGDPQQEEVEYVLEQPEPLSLWDDGCVIFDPPAFAEKYNADAAQVRGGQLFILDKDTREWSAVEPIKKERKLKVIKDKQ